MREPAAKKSLGQHWLYDEASLEAMVMAAEVQPGDTVLEIGPGLGTLTEKLITTGARIFAVEYDEALIPGLEQKFSDNLKIEQGDIRIFDLSQMPVGYKIVANIPYYLTANLMRRLTEDTSKPAVAALLMQKEVAERISAKPGDMSFIAVAAQFYYDVSLGREVPAELFAPPPKVDSQILILKRRGQPLFPDADPAQFFRIAKAGFSQRRKTLLNSLSAGLHLDREKTTDLLAAAGVTPDTRAQALTLTDWYNLDQNHKHLQK